MQHQRQSRQQHKLSQSQRIFTASEVAEYEYCPLTWWYEQYESFVTADTEELFAHTVALEHAHGPQATTLPEYQMIEQLLLRRVIFYCPRPVVASSVLCPYGYLMKAA